MPKYLSPGVYVQETARPHHGISGVDTDVLGILGRTEKGKAGIIPISGFQEFCNIFGGHLNDAFLSYAVEGFFQNGGRRCYVGRIPPSRDGRLTARDFIGAGARPGSRQPPTGLAAFDAINEIRMVYIPDIHLLSGSEAAVLSGAVTVHCETRGDRFAIFDVGRTRNYAPEALQRPVGSSYAAVYTPWIKVSSADGLKAVPPGGHIAGIYARSDLNRGIHKAPANLVVKGASALDYRYTHTEQIALTPKQINTIRQFPGRGIRVWGARTCSSDPEWIYVNVRRFAIFLESSILKGTAWAVFEPNDERLWSGLRQEIGTFLHHLWRGGRLPGSRPEDAYFVACDRATMTRDDIDAGRCICHVGVAMIRPAEFTIIRIDIQSQGTT